MAVNTVLFKLKSNKFISEFLTLKGFIQFIKYIISGLLSAGVEYALLYILTEYVKIWYLISNSIAYISGFWLSFLLNRFWSFKSKESMVKQLTMYGILFAVNFILTNVLMYILTSVSGIPYMISKIFVMGAVVLWNFILYKKVIYKR